MRKGLDEVDDDGGDKNNCTLQFYRYLYVYITFNWRLTIYKPGVTKPSYF